MPNEPTVFVVDDDAAMRHSLRRLISSIGLHVELKKSAEEFLAEVDHRRPGCLVLDVRMHGQSGMDLQDELARRDAERPIIFITAHGDVPMAIRAIRGGAIDFLEKPFQSQVLLDRVQQALERDRQDRERRAERASLDARVRRLTPREREVVELVVRGMTSHEIADELGLRPKTVQVHRANAMERVGVRSAPDLVRLMVLAGVRSAHTPNSEG